jgi:acetyl/propionyl-CoA carboxylase alpha subunit
MKYFVELGEIEVGLEVVHNQEGTVIQRIVGDEIASVTHVDFAPVHSNPQTGEGLYSLIANGKSYEFYVEPSEKGLRIALRGNRFDIRVLTEREWRLKKVAPRQSAHSGELVISAPMPGLVKAVLTSVGDKVTKGQRLLILEAMKMENDITSPADGKVTKINVEPSTVVEGGKPLISIEA